MRRLLVFQHVPHEILGTLDPLLRDAGFRIRYVNFGRHPDAVPDMDAYDGLIVLGGPMNCDHVTRHRHLAIEVTAIQAAVRDGKPVLGICLGAQLLARALGAPVSRNPGKEIGWYDVVPTDHGRRDPLFRHFASAEKIFQWHGDTFAIPDGAVHLASSAACPHQAFRFGRNVYGLQFHLEVDQPMIDRWLKAPANKRELAALKGTIDPLTIAAETPQFIARSRTLGDSVFTQFISLFQGPRRRTVLPSR
ncbi:MAG: gamma-glutamyl-gamma-aminobutyrate hydrolase family protein [Gammaproteobacteria bacterium]